MTIYVLRHTTPDIPKGICYGQSDVPLVKNFNTEFQHIKDQVRLLPYDLIVTSPLSRCQRLAKALQTDSIEVLEDKRLMEMDFGRWEGLSYDAINQDNASKVWYEDYENTACPEGESYKDLQQRMSSFLTDLKQNYSKRTPLIVTHAGNIRALYVLLHHCSLSDAFDIKIDYGGMVTFQV